MKNKLTVTVGIIAHNEQENISNLLISIAKQKQVGFNLEKILVICDGSTDETAKRANKMSKKFTYIKVFNDGKHLGKIKRLMELYKRNESDIVMSFDGDTVLARPDTLEKMVSKFTKPEIVYVGASGMPTKGRTLVETCINTWDKLWDLATKDVNGGNNIYNVHGFGTALRKDFAKRVKFPKGITADARMLYFTARKEGKEFIYAKDAFVSYRSPSTLEEFLSRIHRSSKQGVKFSEVYGKWVENEYTSIPMANKVGAIVQMLSTSPIRTILSGIFMLIAYKYPYTQAYITNNGFWRPISSTKKSIPLTF